jgi:hypothetical protein
MRNGDERMLRSADVPPKGRVLQGKTWDGQDFVQSQGLTFLTARALHWLCRVHARPFYARPAQVWTDGMSAEQLGWLDRARDVDSIK